MVTVELNNVFGAKVVVTITYMINRCPSIALGMNTPKKVWSCHPADLDNLRLFGCVVYAHIRQDKVEPRALVCMFLGYPEGVKACRLWCLEPGHMRCITSHYVAFDEANMTFKKIGDVCQNAKIYEEEQERKEFPIKVEHLGNEVDNHEENPY